MAQQTGETPLKALGWTAKLASKYGEQGAFVRVGGIGPGGGLNKGVGKILFDTDGRAWKANPDFLFVLPLRIAGNAPDITEALTASGYSPEEIRSYLAQGITLANLTQLTPGGRPNPGYDQKKVLLAQEEVRSSQEKRSVLRTEKEGDLAGYGLSDLEWLTDRNRLKAAVFSTGKAGQNGLAAPVVRRRTGLGRLTFKQRFQQLVEARAGGGEGDVVIDVTNLNEAGHGYRAGKKTVSGKKIGFPGDDPIPLVSETYQGMTVALRQLGDLAGRYGITEETLRALQARFDPQPQVLPPVASPTVRAPPLSRAFPKAAPVAAPVPALRGGKK